MITAHMIGVSMVIMPIYIFMFWISPTIFYINEKTTNPNDNVTNWLYLVLIIHFMFGYIALCLYLLN